MRFTWILGALLCAQPCFAATIDFDGVSSDDLLITPYLEDGFTVTKTAGDARIDAAPFWQAYSAGSDPVLGMFVTGTVTLTESGGGTFDFTSFDYEGDFVIASGNTITITSDLGGSYTTNTVGTHDLSADPNFQGVTTITFNDTAGGNWYWSVDNLNATASVPEPSTYGILLVLLGVAGLRRRFA